jgi:predicted nucleic acid-binding protein
MYSASMNSSSRWRKPCKPPFTTITRICEETFTEAGTIFKKSRGYSFTDCKSFIVMKRYGLTHVLTFDRNFRDAGF